MTRSRKLLLALLIVIAVITFLRETGRLNLHFYRNSISVSNNGTWDNKVYKVGQSPLLKMVEHCDGSQGLKQVPLIVSYDGQEIGEKGTTTCPPVVVEIDEIKHGPLWTPLYKNISFNATVPVKGHASTTWHTADTALAGEYELKGTLDVRGKLSITGTCSARDARGMITSKVMQTVYDAVRAEMNRQK